MIDNESEVEKYLKETGIDFTDKQLLYIKDVLLGSTHVSNWSVAGSGKSLCLEVIKNYLEDRCVVCASTGIANSILFDNKGGDGTLCRVMSIPTSMHTEYHTKKINSSTRKLLSGSDLVTHIFVEEAGMCNPDQIELLMKHVKRFNRAYGKKRKKRDIKVILQGDFLQLPNIVDDKEKPLMKDLYGGHTLFDSNILKTYGFSVHIFTKVLRTNDKTFQAALDVLRYGQEHRYDRCLQWLNKRYQPHNMPADMPIIATTNKKVDEANKKALESNPNEPMTFDMTISGKFDIKSCPADESITLKVGMPVITLTNEQNGLWSNGSYGHVTQLSTEGIYVIFKGNGEEHFVPLHLFEETETTVSDEVVTVEVEGVVSSTTKKVLNKEVIGSAFQLAVKPAAAFSVFRMQGRTLDVPALVDLGDWGFPLSQDNEWGWGQCYTALSRFRKVEDIYLAQPLTRKHIKPCRSAVSWVEAYVNSYE